MPENIIQLVETLASLLLEHELMLTTAESCTGGGLAYALTSISAGCSKWFDRSLVTYSNVAKQDLVNVSQQTLTTYGAVSAEVAKAMAEGALRNSLANLTIAITGIAGPDGGSEEKPVGTVWFGFARERMPTITLHQQFSGDRKEIREQAIVFALENLIKQLQSR